MKQVIFVTGPAASGKTFWIRKFSFSWLDVFVAGSTAQSVVRAALQHHICKPGVPVAIESIDAPAQDVVNEFESQGWCVVFREFTKTAMPREGSD